MERPIPHPGHQVKPKLSNGHRLKVCAEAPPKAYKPISASSHTINSNTPEWLTFITLNIRIECQLLNRPIEPV